MTDELSNSKPILDRFRLDGRVALVTGGGQGIGRAFAHALTEAGAAVAVVDIVLDRAEQVAQELIDKGGEAIAIPTDVTDPDQVAAMVQTIVDKWGSLTIGVNNAGIGAWQAAESMSVSQWQRMMDINLKGVFLCAQAEARVMFQAGYGKIINTASMSAHIANRPQPQVAYNASKAGVLHMTRTLAGEWADRGVRVNSISPGYTATDLVLDLVETPEASHMLPIWMDQTPLGRMAEVTDLQGGLVFLASEASDFMTGSDLLIDGGYCVW